MPPFLKERKPIIVTTQQKFEWVLEEMEKNEDLKSLRVERGDGTSPPKVVELWLERGVVAAPAGDEEQLGIAAAGPLVVQLQTVEVGVRHDLVMVSLSTRLAFELNPYREEDPQVPLPSPASAGSRLKIATFGSRTC